MNKKWKGEGNKPMGKKTTMEPSPNAAAKKTWGIKKIGHDQVCGVKSIKVPLITLKIVEL